MAIKVISNTGNGQIEDGSIVSFSFTEEVSSIGPSNLTGGISDVSLTVAQDFKDSLLLVNNNITLSDGELGDVAFQVKSMSASPGVVSMSGPTIQSRLNVIKKAEHHTGDLATALQYYCGLVGGTPVFDGSIGAHLAAVPVSLLAWEDSVWNKIKELIAVSKAFDSSRIVTTGGVLNDGYYPFEAYIETANNEMHFREALNNSVAISEDLAEQSFSVNSFDGGKSVSVTGYMTYTKDDFIDPIYEVSSYELPAGTAKASVDFSGTTFNANETITKLFDMDTHITEVLQPRCVSSISRVPYRKAMGNVVSMTYTPSDPFTSSGTIRATIEDVGYQNAPAVGEKVRHTSVAFTDITGTPVTISSLIEYEVTASDQALGYYEFVVTSSRTTSFSGDATGSFEVTNAVGEYVIVGDGDIPIKPEEWVAQGGSLSVATTSVPGQIEITVIAPGSDTLVSAEDSNQYVNGPFQVGVEVADSGQYPACWLLATGVSFEKKTVIAHTGIEEGYTSKDAVTSVDNIFINGTDQLYSMALSAAQDACGPKLSMNATTVDPVAFNSLIGAMVNENNNSYRITSVGHDGYNATIEASPIITMKDFNEFLGTSTFELFNVDKAFMVFNEFTIYPRKNIYG